MKKIIKLTESDLTRIVEKVINETKILKEGSSIFGRNFVINSDGTVSISDRNGNLQKIRMTTKLGDINVIKIEPSNGGYNITGKSGITEFADNDKIKQVISFVDSNSPSEIESDSWKKPNLILKKV